jgi:hypothetical protein
LKSDKSGHQSVSTDMSTAKVVRCPTTIKITHVFT